MSAAASLSPDRGHPDHITPGDLHIAPLTLTSPFLIPFIQLNHQRHTTDLITSTPDPSSDLLTLSST